LGNKNQIFYSKVKLFVNSVIVFALGGVLFFLIYLLFLYGNYGVSEFLLSIVFSLISLGLFIAGLVQLSLLRNSKPLLSLEEHGIRHTNLFGRSVFWMWESIDHIRVPKKTHFFRKLFSRYQRTIDFHRKASRGEHETISLNHYFMSGDFYKIVELLKRNEKIRALIKN